MKTRNVVPVLPTAKILLVAAVALVLDLAPSARAATLIVTNLANSGTGTLRNHLASAGSGDTILFDTNLSGQTITLTSGQILINKANITIDASALPEGIIISGNTNSRVFTVDFSQSATLNGLTITSGFASGNGGGIDNLGTLTLNNCTLTGNRVASGYHGGAIENFGTLRLSGCTINNNSSMGSSSSGGAIVNSFGTTLSINNSTFSSNSATNGGAIDNTDGMIFATNCTFHGNSSSSGGAIYTGSSSLKTNSFYNCTFSGNSATSGGAIYNFTSSRLTIENSIVANNSATGAGPDISGSINIVSGVNFIGSTNGATGLGIPGVNYLTGNPMLAVLGNNGGRTQTMLPLPGSPVINAGIVTGSTPTTDQRGLTRVVNGAVDIGACEVQVIVATEPPMLTSLSKLGDGSFRFAFTNMPGAAFTALATTNVLLPLSNWTVLGIPTETPAGQYQFTDPQATNNPQRFYRIRSP